MLPASGGDPLSRQGWSGDWLEALDGFSVGVEGLNTVTRRVMESRS